MQEKARPGPPRSVVVAVSLLTLFAIGWTIYWFTFRARLQDDVADLRASLADLGMRLDCAGETWTGFPFRYELACPQPRLHGIYEGRPAEVSALNLRLFMQAYNPFHVMALVEGPTRLNGTTVSHEPARASLRYDTRGNWDLAVEAPATDIAGAASADMLKLFARVQAGRLQLAANAQDLQPAVPKLPILSVAVTAETDAAFLTVPDLIRFARTSGTPIDVTSLKLSSGRVTAEGSGQLHLDSAGRLNGKLTSTVNDLDGLLALLAPPFNLTPQQVTGATTVIGLISGNQPGAPASLDIIAKQGELYFGPFKIADIPPLE